MIGMIFGMAQIHVFEPEDSKFKEKLKSLGFRWCKKDKRFEKACKDTEYIKSQLEETLPHVDFEVR